MVDAQVPAKATVLNVETDFGLPVCVFSGCVEDPANRVVPTLTVLKESARQQHEWGLIPGNARILSQVPSRVKGMLGAVALRRLGEEALGMVGSAAQHTIASTLVPIVYGTSSRRCRVGSFPSLPLAPSSHSPGDRRLSPFGKPQYTPPFGTAAPSSSPFLLFSPLPLLPLPLLLPPILVAIGRRGPASGQEQIDFDVRA